MSQENVDVACRVLEQISRGGFTSAWDLIDSDLEWETSPNLPDAGVNRGRLQVRAFLEEQWEIVWGGPPRVDIERTFDCGDNVLLFIRLRGHGSHTGIPLDVSIANLVTVSNGKVARLKVYPDRVEALEAAGLSE
jgi:ketosteroid isomerase-like protein